VLADATLLNDSGSFRLDAARQVVEEAQKRMEEILRPNSIEQMSGGAEAGTAMQVILPTMQREPSLLQRFQQFRIRKRQNFNLK
jgi:hypothetical protein